MTMNPVPPETTSDKVQKALARFGYRHGELVVFVVGVVVGFVLSRL